MTRFLDKPLSLARPTSGAARAPTAPTKPKAPAKPKMAPRARKSPPTAAAAADPKPTGKESDKKSVDKPPVCIEWRQTQQSCADEISG